MALKKRKSVCNSSYKDMLGSGLASIKPQTNNKIPNNRYVEKSHALASNSVNTWGSAGDGRRGEGLVEGRGEVAVLGLGWLRLGFHREQRGQRPEMVGGNLTQQEILRGERWSRGGLLPSINKMESGLLTEPSKVGKAQPISDDPRMSILTPEWGR
ncbi:hypothetical protein NC652_038930 [Populus alba x Populus x berolinensis]|nr:hypothetical protein NC652_038930 [Populus alba x Populus x berolinensis]